VSDVEHRNRLIEGNLGLAHAAAQRFGRWACQDENDMDDLVQIATLLLIRAAEKWDPLRGIAFSTYATVWMERGLRREASVLRTIIHIPEQHTKESLREQIRRLSCQSIEGDSLGWLLANERPGSKIELEELWERIEATLTPRQYQIMWSVYGPTGTGSMIETAKVLGVSPQAVSATIEASRGKLLACGLFRYHDGAGLGA